MNVPKFIRRWVYKRILKRIDDTSYHEPTYLCVFCRFKFPYMNIERYPELWDRKESLTWFRWNRDPHIQAWFYNDEDRRKYVQEALDLVTNKTK